MVSVEVLVTIEACGECKSLVVVLETKELTVFAQRLLKAAVTIADEVKAETKTEDKCHKWLFTELRRGYLAGVEEGIRQERKNEQSDNYRAYHCTHRD